MFFEIKWGKKVEKSERIAWSEEDKNEEDWELQKNWKRDKVLFPVADFLKSTVFVDSVLPSYTFLSCFLQDLRNV
jgi:hypothetical protein